MNPAPRASQHFLVSEVICKCRKDSCDYKDTLMLADKQKQKLAQLMKYLDAVRNELKQPVYLSSVLRCSKHPVEQRKEHPGAHWLCGAADIVLPESMEGRLHFLEVITSLGRVHDLQGLGVAKTFVHVDFGHPKVARPAYWTYK